MSSISKKQLIYLLRRLGSDQKVAKELNLSRQTIYNLRKKYGIASAKKNIQGRNIILVQKYLHGVSAEALAQEYHLSLPRIYQILQQSQTSTAHHHYPKILSLEHFEHLKKEPHIKLKLSPFFCTPLT